MSRQVRLATLHGFLGSPTDWDSVRPLLPGIRLEALDAWQITEALAEPNWEQVGEALAASIRAMRQSDPGCPLFLAAYSFGARLTLAASRAFGCPDCPVDGVIFVSGHPGMPDDDRASREARRQSDETWAEMLESAPVERIWASWNAQAVLADSREPQHRTELPAPRHVLARAMRAFSLARQPDFRPALRSWPTPWLWIWGERDEKFAGLADSLRAAEMSGRLVACPAAGHRVPWDNPVQFSAIVRRWMDEVTPPDGAMR